MLDNELRKLPKKYKVKFSESLNNSQLYENRLLEAFPIKRDANCAYFQPDTFTGDDEKSYWEFRNIFDGKNWNEVDLTVLYSKHYPFTTFSLEGFLYYLPICLKFFYDIRHFMILPSVLLESFEYGITTGPTVSWDDRAVSDLSFFDRLTPAQSKLVALFVADLAILLPEQYSERARRALSNYWGKFLLSCDAS